MAEYHVGCGAFGIYAGTLEPKNKKLWRNKSNVTEEALDAVAEFLYLNDKAFNFYYHGHLYRLEVVDGEEGEGHE